MTPYIFDDRVRFEDVAEAIMYWYQMDEAQRIVYGMHGRNFCLENGLTAEQMGNKMIEMFHYLFNANREARPLYTVTKTQQTKYERTGIVA